jgi:microcystin degradation protein MlrC
LKLSFHNIEYILTKGAPMKFVIAMMKHETNTFCPLPTAFESFNRNGGPHRGQTVIDAWRGTNFAIAAFIDLAEKEAAEIVAPIAGSAEPSGYVSADAHAIFVEEICAAVESGCDALLLDLHGAMVVDDNDDGEGKLLAKVREIAPDLPIAVALDFHTNLSEEMVNNATVITGYRTYPHVDLYETGLRAGQTLLRALKGEVNPTMVWGRRPMLPHMLCQSPARQPMKDIMDLAIALEDRREVLNASVLGGFPLADIPHACLSAVVVSDGDVEKAQKSCNKLLDMAWERRADFVYPIEPLEKSVSYAKNLKNGPVVLVDHGDNAGAGGTQDVMSVLEEIMHQGLKNVIAGPFCDPESVARMIQAGVGSTITLNLGGKNDMPALNLKGRPLEITGVVRAITDGTWTVRSPMMTGIRTNIGRTAVLATEGMVITVSEKRMEPFDVGIFSHCGVEVLHAKYILIKSRQHYRAAFERIAEHIVELAGPGVCSSDYSLFPFKNLKRPIYPLDEMEALL